MSRRPAVPTFAKNIFFGGFSGILGVSSVYPVDLVKTRLQNQTSGKRSAIATAKKILRADGVLGFYKGLPPQVLGIGPEKAIVMSVREGLLARLGDRSSSKNQFLAGIGAGLIQCSVSNPVEVVKVRAQVAVGPSKIMPIVRSLGIKGLYRGYTACMCRDLTFGGVYFPMYEILRSKISNQMGVDSSKPPLIVSLLAGTIAGIPAAALSTPADVIKTRMQAGGALSSASFFNAARSVSAEGPATLFAGMGPRVLRLSPQFGVILISFETMKRCFPDADEGIV